MDLTTLRPKFYLKIPKNDSLFLKKIFAEYVTDLLVHSIDFIKAATIFYKFNITLIYIQNMIIICLVYAFVKIECRCQTRRTCTLPSKQEKTFSKEKNPKNNFIRD